MINFGEIILVSIIALITLFLGLLVYFKNKKSAPTHIFRPVGRGVK